MYTRKTSLEYEETNPIRFENHKSELVMLLNQVRALTKSSLSLTLIGMSYESKKNAHL